MAGRGRAATLPAWITSRPIAITAPGAPGAPGAVAFSPPPPSGAGAPIASNAPDAASAWTEHTAPDGRRKYWHNASTGKSTYDKPACLMTATERADATTRWKEAVAPDGRAYFHNLDTKETRWTMPDAVRAAREAAFLAEGAAAAQKALTRANADSADARARGDGTANAPTREETEAAAFAAAAPEDPEAAFAACLAACGVTSTQRWDETIRAVERRGDDRFYALKTAGARKKAFHEYQARQKKREREEKRAEDKRRRGAFEAMLREAEATLGCGAPGFGFREVAEDLAKDARYAERFRAVADDRGKEDLYRAHCDALRVRERERRRLARDDERRRFAERLASPPAAVDFETETWRDARRKMAELPDPERERLCAGCDRYDQLAAFESKALEAEEAAEARRTVAELRRRVAERDVRDAFVAFLEKKRRAGRLTLRLPWRDFVRAEALEEEEAYVAVSRNASGSRPRELYEDQQEILETRAARDRAAATTALARSGALEFADDAKTGAADATTTRAPRSAAVRRALARTDPESLVVAGERHLDAFEAALHEAEGGDSASEASEASEASDVRARLRRACLDAAAVAAREEATRVRRRRRAAEAFASLLESSLRRRVVRRDWTWEEVARELSREPEWRDMCGRSADGASRRDEERGYVFAEDDADRDAYVADARTAFAAAFAPATETRREEGELEEGEAPDPKRARRRS